MSHPWAFVCVLAFAAVGVHSKGFYTVVGPKVVRPNSFYHAAVSVEGVSEPTTVTVELGGRQDSGGHFKTHAFVHVEPYATRVARLEVGDLGPGNYNLSVSGSGGLAFYNTTKLGYVHKSYSVFVQTDKAIYKPGHKVLFRVLLLSSYLRPSVKGSIDIHITDGDGNRVKQWTRVLPTQGVFTSELQLSSSPVLGDWKITVTLLDQVFSKTFRVAEYVLPKFEVTVDVPPHVYFQESKFVATVKSKYTYGRAVKGEATVSINPRYVSEVLQPTFKNLYRKVLPIDGETTVEIDLKKLGLSEDYERVLQIDVTVEEALTGRRQNNTAQTILHRNKYSMELIRTSDFFKPGLKYTAFIKLSQHDGTPIIDTKYPVKIWSDFSHQIENNTEAIHKISTNGIIEVVFYPPSNVSALNIEAEYLGVRENFGSIGAAQSPSNSFIQATVKTEKPTVNRDVEIEVNSTEPLSYVSYQVMGRGDIILGDTVKVSRGERTVSWRFVTSHAMAPTAHVIVQYVREDGEVVADSIDIELNSVLQNFVNVDVNPSETEPGSSVEIKLEAKPQSYIGLLGIDQSVLLLQSGNDIVYDDVIKELKSYDTGDLNMMDSYISLRDKRSAFSYPGSFNTLEVYDKSGAVILTNGYVNDFSPWSMGGDVGGVKPADWSPVISAGGVTGRPRVTVTRPPLAGPYAFSRIPKPVWTQPRVFLPHRLADTWLFSNLSAGSDGKATLRKTVPDTITSWAITAFSIDSVNGLGLIEAPRKVKVFRPFFVSLDLPYSIIKGETVSIPVVVFNYYNQELAADVTIENTGQFEFADYSNDVYQPPKLELFRRKKLKIPANSGATTSFMITPKELGYISIKVSAKSTIAGDAVERKLLVKPEGETQYKNIALFVDLRSKNSLKTNVTLDIPTNIVAESEIIEISAVGDILGPSIPNLAHLIKMPFGCGEQNMLNFVPNIVILDYLKNSNQLTQAVESRSLQYLEAGYQQELSYKREDGSFSAFGKADPKGSTWLTAFVVRSFRQASRYINVEGRVIEKALEWLAGVQDSEGRFPEVGQVSHRDMQGGAARGLALTAYTLIAFQENTDPATGSRYTNIVSKALNFIASNVNGLDDNYAIAISAYALQLAGHPAKELAFNLLESKAQSKDDMKWWKRSERESDKKNPHALLPNSVDVEMTAYAMLTYLHKGLVEDSVPIMKWMVSQQNEGGGFASTQDTVIALGAIAKLAERIVTRNNDITVTFSYGKGVSHDIRVNSANSMILQKNMISRKVRELNITATGRGFAIVQVSYRYNVNVTGAWPLFSLDPQIDKTSDSNRFQLSVCSGFVPTKEANESNMAVMEIELPSGYTVDPDSLPSLQLSHSVKRIETKNGDTVVVLYFDKMTRNENCPTVKAFRTHKVAFQRPVPVTLYDYYDQSRRARMFYDAKMTTSCDICENEDCRMCQDDGKPGSQSSKNDKGSATALCLAQILLVLPAVLLYYTQQLI